MNFLWSHLFSQSTRRIVRPAPRRKPQAPPVGADWLALARPSQDRSRTVYDPTGAALALRKSDILAHGGEGVVYNFAKNPAYLIKVCKDDTLRDTRKLAAFRGRLNAMLALEEMPQRPVPRLAADARFRSE